MHSSAPEKGYNFFVISYTHLLSYGFINNEKQGVIRMKTFNKLRVNKIDSLRREGFSYKEIAKLLEISTGSAYKYAHKIPISSRGKKRIALLIKNNQDKFASMHVRREIVRPNRITKEFIRILGHCLFDGSVCRDGINYSNTSKELIELFKQDMLNVFKIYPSNVLTHKKVHDVIIVYYNYRSLSEFLWLYAPSYSTSDTRAEIPPFIFELSEDLICEYLRTFWEDEGCIKADGSITGKTKSVKVARQLVMLHRKIGVTAALWRDSTNDAYDVTVPVNRSNVRKFAQLIAFRNSRVCRGKYMHCKKVDVLHFIHKDKLGL